MMQNTPPLFPWTSSWFQVINGTLRWMDQAQAWIHEYTIGPTNGSREDVWINQFGIEAQLNDPYRTTRADLWIAFYCVLGFGILCWLYVFVQCFRSRRPRRVFPYFAYSGLCCCPITLIPFDPSLDYCKSVQLFLSSRGYHEPQTNQRIAYQMLVNYNAGEENAPMDDPMDENASRYFRALVIDGHINDLKRFAEMDYLNAVYNYVVRCQKDGYHRDLIQFYETHKDHPTLKTAVCQEAILFAMLELKQDEKAKHIFEHLLQDRKYDRFHHFRLLEERIHALKSRVGQDHNTIQIQFSSTQRDTVCRDHV